MHPSSCKLPGAFRCCEVQFLSEQYRMHPEIASGNPGWHQCWCLAKNPTFCYTPGPTTSNIATEKWSLWRCISYKPWRSSMAIWLFSRGYFFGGGRSVGTWCRQESLDSDSYRSYSYSQHGSLLDLSGFASYVCTIVTPGKEHQSQDSGRNLRCRTSF